MIVMLPAFACNFLGEDFFTDILTLKETGSIQKMNITDAFDVLHRGAERLQVGAIVSIKFLALINYFLFLMSLVRSHGSSTAVL